MPTGKAATEFLERMAKLEERVENLMTFQKWQVGIMATILAGVLTTLVVNALR